MYWPTPADYQEAIQTTESCFQDFELSKSTPNILSNGLVESILGAKAIIYHLKTNDRAWAVCCFLEPIDFKQSDEENYGQKVFDKYLADIWHQGKNNLTYLVKGIKVKGEFYPIIKMDWVSSLSNKVDENKILPVSTNQLELPKSKPTSPFTEQQTTSIDIITQSILPSEDPNANSTNAIEADTRAMDSNAMIFNQTIESNELNKSSELVEQAIPPTQIMEPVFEPVSTPPLTTKKGSDLNFTTQISLEEAFNGTSVSIKIPKLETCITCYGKGMLNEKTKCRACKGQSKIISEKAFNINIPPGIKDGERLCMVGEGEAGFEGGESGDLYVNVLVRQHPSFQREENDLYYIANISASQLGQNISILSLSGQIVTCNIPLTAKDETVITLAGQGMPLVGETKRGNLYVKVKLAANINNINNLANYQNPQPYNPSPQKQVYPNQPPRPYMDPYRDPSNDPSRSPYPNPPNHPQANMQIQNMAQYPLYNQSYNQSIEGQEALIQKIKTSAMLSFALSVLSLFCLGIFVGPVSFFLSRKALRLIHTYNIGNNYKSWAIVGQILSVFSFILSGLMFLLIIFEG
ncbi:MAG: hypothetical protein HY819_09165 [Acidobacteria bacterium]|nr:hypothetical protein [Acidobacteriota bacterium]